LDILQRDPVADVSDLEGHSGSQDITWFDKAYASFYILSCVVTIRLSCNVFKVIDRKSLNFHTVLISNITHTSEQYRK